MKKKGGTANYENSSVKFHAVSQAKKVKSIFRDILPHAKNPQLAVNLTEITGSGRADT